MRRFWKKFLIVASLPLAAYLWFRIDNAVTVGRLEKAVRTKKAPLTLSDLSKLYPTIPDEQDAAIPLLELWRLDDPAFWKAFESGSATRPETRSEPALLKRASEYGSGSKSLLENQTFLKEARDHVASMENRRQAVRRAMERGKSRFAIPFEEGPDALLPHLRCMVREANEFHIEALVAIADDRSSDAVRAIESIAATGNLMRDDPLLLGQIKRFNCLMLASSDISRLLTHRQPTAAMLDRIETIVDSMDASDAFPRMLMAERAMCLSAFSRPQSYYVFDSENEPRRLSPNAMRAYGILGINAADRRLILETYSRMDRFSALTTCQDLEQIRKALANARSEARSFPPKIISQSSLPPIGGLAARCLRMKVMQSAARTAIAVERHRLQTRRIPALLDDLKPRWLAEIPTDLFNGEPLQFEVLDRGYIIYSVGSNGKDDDGIPSLGLDPSRSPDVVFGVGR